MPDPKQQKIVERMPDCVRAYFQNSRCIYELRQKSLSDRTHPCALGVEAET